MNITKQYWVSNLLFLMVLILGIIFGGFGSGNLTANAGTLGCSELHIEGDYQCDVACVVRDVDTGGVTSFTAPYGMETSEIDTIKHFPIKNAEINDPNNTFYEVSIESRETDGGNVVFIETEIGPFVGCTLRTATERVSEGGFPVLEEYIFDEGSGSASNFTKIVRNPSQENFKTCKVSCNRLTN